MKRLALGVALALCAACNSGESSTVTNPSGSDGSDGSDGSESVVTDSALAVPSTGSPVSETPTPDSPEAADVMVPQGFSTTIVEITKADGSTCEVCMWLADTADERGQGLMGVTDLGDAEGMAFVFDRPTNGAFFMFQTVTPLSIAWFAPDGALVSAADMDPCESDDSSQCERFPAGGQFDLAIEVFQGDLPTIGIQPGAIARVVPGTEAETCPVARP